MGKAKFNFGPACEGETIVFGAERPGRDASENAQAHVGEWMDFMQREGILRVLCLLDASELKDHYPALIVTYEKRFGERNVCWSPVTDRYPCTRDALHREILPFLSSSSREKEPVVVHCSAGMGRTGLVLAAWVVHRHGVRARRAIEMVQQWNNSGPTTRSPCESVSHGNATQEDIARLLRTVSRSRESA